MHIKQLHSPVSFLANVNTCQKRTEPCRTVLYCDQAASVNTCQKRTEPCRAVLYCDQAASVNALLNAMIYLL